VADGLSSYDAIGRIFHGIPDLASPELVQSSLREILDDPTLELFWWDWERERYVDVHGGDQGALDAYADRVVTFVDYESRKVGAVAHGARLLERPQFLETFVPMLRIAMERDRLHRDLVSKLDELKASRLRLLTAGDEERRRLERNLHDGAQQRLTVALLALRRLEQRIGGDADAASVARFARQELEGAIEDLRELARGLHPPLLARRGLAAAVRAASARSAVPIELDLRLDRELPHALEAAAYYVCAEAVTNTVKHARASRVWLSIVHANETLTVSVRDDGVGGACIDCEGEASGLGGLLDRVQAFDGTLDLVSPPGEGTRLVATFPLPGD
jgi:signal transduction histidine kinase